MKTIDGDSTHRHSWRRIGAHALHACRTSQGALREVRHVSVCMVEGCKEVRVHIRHHMAYAHSDEQVQALARQMKRIPGQTAVAQVRKKNGTAKPQRSAALVERVTLQVRVVEKVDSP